MPSSAMPCAGVSVSGRPWKRIEPSLNAYSRDRQLKRVVLPAPFGPISPTMRPGATENETLSSAVMPPKRTVTSATSSKACGGADASMGASCGWLTIRHDLRNGTGVALLDADVLAAAAGAHAIP